MKKGTILVEQINQNNEIVIDFDETLNKKNLLSVFQNHFPALSVKDNYLYGTYSNQKFCIYTKNISYLGRKHPIYKKRIQLTKDLMDLYQKNEANNIKTLIIGLYKYKDTIVFCDYDISTYIKNKKNSSSAHVFVNDLLSACEKGIHVKKDKRKNIITCFRTDYICDFLNLKFNNIKTGINKVIETIKEFNKSLNHTWNGIDCYSEMIKANFKDKYQAEWAGFYLEFKIYEYLKNTVKNNLINYQKNKTADSIDLDLYFPEIGFYGDLKTHSLGSSIQGNDYDTIMELVENSKVYYFVYEHETIKDKDCLYVVTEYWNSILGKKNLRSYGNKMKNSIILKNFHVLEINNYNKKFLKKYNQGVNSNGQPREPKILIDKKYLDNFIIYSSEFEND